LAHRYTGVDLSLSDDDRRLLKAVARASIEEVLFEKKGALPDMPENLKKKMGAFVTLKIRGDLKGCIGYIRGQLPLDETVRQMAKEAAFHDPRFMPLDVSEWMDTDIEISVLTPLRRIADVEEIQVGIHGIYIEKGLDSGLLLPQVATENGWDRETFLGYACMKAGLSSDAWKMADTRIYIFSADVF
jgi:AmmeMemoRadiSam system protein A